MAKQQDPEVAKTPEAAEAAGACDWRKFLPALLLYPAWVYVMVKRDAWEEASHYWGMSLAMVMGSFIAGSTPVGGGVVAFPVLVLHLQMQPTQGRDFSLLIQAVGMSAASFLILYSKRHLCHFWLILWIYLGGLCGLLLGLELPLSGRLVSLIFTTSVSCFAIAYFYHREGKSQDEEVTGAIEPWGLGGYVPWLLWALALAFGMLGGLLTALVGSGADMMAYIYGILWNALAPEARISENMLTASSVLIMAGMSVLGSLLRLLTGTITQEVIFCWAATAPVVVLGAPLGAMLLTPRRSALLRRCFYVLVLVQLVSMCALQLRGDVAWTLVSAALLTTTLLSHVLFRCR